MKKSFQIFFLSNFLKGYFKALPEKQFFSKTFFCFFIEISILTRSIIKINHYSQLKKQVKVYLETRSYQFLTNTHQKNPRSGIIPDLKTTLEIRMNEFSLIISFTFQNINFGSCGFCYYKNNSD